MSDKILTLNEEFNNSGIGSKHVEAVKAFFETGYKPDILKMDLKSFGNMYDRLFKVFIAIVKRPFTGKTALP